MTLRKIPLIWLATLSILIVLSCLYVLPVANEFYSDVKARETYVAQRNDYKAITTPLSDSVVEHICLKIDITTSSENCESATPVYAPDLFDEIETYFNDLPRKRRTYDNVQNKLGAYLDYCEKPDADGSYRCVYDLRGDDLYPVYFYFDKEGFYYRMSADWDRQDF